MGVLTQNPAFLMSGVSANAIGTPYDNRQNGDYGYLWYQESGNSAIFHAQASYDPSGAFVTFLTVTAIIGSGHAAVSAYYPYIRIQLGSAFSAAGGSAALMVHWTPGVR